jgi:hypothetical protein
MLEFLRGYERRRGPRGWCLPGSSPLARQLEEAAFAADRSKSAEIRVALRRHLEREQEERDAPTEG